MVNNPIKAVLVGLLALSLGLAACKKDEDTATAADVKPTRPPSPSGTMSLHGNYTRTGTIGVFQDCTTGEQWRVAREGDDAALEQAYAESGVQPGEPLLVTVEGGIDLRPRTDGPGSETMLIVARFVRVGPGKTCP